MTAPVVSITRASGKGRQPAVIEDLRDHRDDLAAHTREALEFVDRSGPMARQLELALESIVTDDPFAHQVWRRLHNLAGALVHELERYERQHLPVDPDPIEVAA